MQNYVKATVVNLYIWHTKDFSLTSQVNIVK